MPLQMSSRSKIVPENIRKTVNALLAK